MVRAFPAIGSESVLTPSIPRPSRRLAVFALLLVTGALAVLGTDAFRRKLESFQPLGFEAVPAADHWLVRRVSSPPPAALAAGDRIVLVNGSEAATLGDLRRLLRRSPEAQLVVLRGDRLESITWHRPPLDVDGPWLVLAALGLIYVAMGLFTLWRAPDGVLFHLWCLASAVLFGFSPVFPVVDGTGAAIYLADALARIALAPLTVHLFLSIPRTSPRRPWIAFLYLPAAILGALQIDLVVTGGRFLFGAPTAAALRTLDRLELAHLAIAAVAAIGVLVHRLARIREWEQRRQLLWLLVGMAAGYAPFLAAYGLPFAIGMRPPEPLAVLAVTPLACVPLTFGWAILRYRLWDLGVMVRSGSSWILTVLLGVASFSLLDLALGRAVPEGMAFARQLLTFFGGLSIAGLAIPARRGLHGALERFAYGRAAFGRRRGLVRLGQELLQERDLDRLCQGLIGELEQGLDLDRVNLLLAQGSSLLPVHPEAALPDSVPGAALPARLWEGSFETLSAIELPGEPANAEQRLWAAGYRYVFPLRVRNARIGLVLTTLRGDGHPMNSDDVEIVRAVLDQAALAIENAQLLDQVQRQLEHVVSLQQRNQGILESSPAGIAVLDEDGTIASANLAFAALAGRPRGELIGAPLADALPLPALPESGAGPCQLPCQDAHGRERIVEASLATLRDELHDGQSVLVLQDVTERVAMETALKEKDRLASLGVLAAGVAHEVNTPLTGISSYAQILLADTEPGDPRRDLLEKVEKQTFRASRIVSNLLDFARRPGRERERLDLVALLRETDELLRERRSARSVALELDVPEDELCVVGSAGELQQVFTNLILNAIDALAPRGGGHVRVRARRDGERIRVEVEDDGPGIAEEHLQAIFEPFFTTRRGQGGTGLGLSICRSIVEQHDGRIAAENPDRGGCRFTVDLPGAPDDPGTPG